MLPLILFLFGENMPHDLNGKLLEAGDKVMVPAIVKEVYSTENGEYCNCNLVTEHPMPPYTEGTHLVLNAKQVIKSE